MIQKIDLLDAREGHAIQAYILSRAAENVRAGSLKAIRQKNEARRFWGMMQPRD